MDLRLGLIRVSDRRGGELTILLHMLRWLGEWFPGFGGCLWECNECVTGQPDAPLKFRADYEIEPFSMVLTVVPRCTFIGMLCTCLRIWHSAQGEGSALTSTDMIKSSYCR
jgi:hypothetical protein